MVKSPERQINARDEVGQQVGERDPGERGNGRQRVGSRCLGPGTWPGQAGPWCLGPGGSHEGQRRAGVQGPRGGSGLQGHRTVLIQRHRSDGMRAINYCDKMQSWPAHCRRADRSLSPAPHRVPCPGLGQDASAHLSPIPPTTHAPTEGQEGLQPLGRDRNREEEGPKISPDLPRGLSLPSAPHPHHDLGGSNCHNAHFTDADTGDQTRKVTCLKFHMGEW